MGLTFRTRCGEIHGLPSELPFIPNPISLPTPRWWAGGSSQGRHHPVPTPPCAATTAAASSWAGNQRAGEQLPAPRFQPGLHRGPRRDHRARGHEVHGCTLGVACSVRYGPSSRWGRHRRRLALVAAGRSSDEGTAGAGGVAQWWACRRRCAASSLEEIEGNRGAAGAMPPSDATWPNRAPHWSADIPAPPTDGLSH